MSGVDELLATAPQRAGAAAAPGLDAPPKRKLAVVACMDARIEPFAVLGIDRGDAHVIRNAGGVITDDVIRSLSASQRFLGTEEVLVVMHEGCGMQGAPEELGGFEDLDATLRAGVERLRAAPELPARDHVHGAVLDLETGSLRPVV